MLQVSDITSESITVVETKGCYYTSFPGSRTVLFQNDDAERSRFREKVAKDLKAEERAIRGILNKETVIVQCNGYRVPVHFHDGKVVVWLEAAEKI